MAHAGFTHNERRFGRTMYIIQCTCDDAITLSSHTINMKKRIKKHSCKPTQQYSVCSEYGQCIDLWITFITWENKSMRRPVRFGDEHNNSLWANGILLLLNGLYRCHMSHLNHWRPFNWVYMQMLYLRFPFIDAHTHSMRPRARASEREREKETPTQRHKTRTYQIFSPGKQTPYIDFFNHCRHSAGCRFVLRPILYDIDVIFGHRSMGCLVNCRSPRFIRRRFADSFFSLSRLFLGFVELERQNVFCVMWNIYVFNLGKRVNRINLYLSYMIYNESISRSDNSNS